MPGVVTVLTSADVPGEGDTGPARRDEPLFPDEVMFHHQPVAWVLAETLDAAQRGAARVVAEYEALPAILTIDEAIAQDAYLAGPFRITRGDVAALETCALRCTGELRIGGQEHFYLETQAALAWLDETGGVGAALVDAASVRDAGGRGARAGRATASRHGRVPADGRRIRRQGDAGQRRGPRSRRSARGRRSGRCACG